MENLNFETGTVKLTINNDPTRVIEFDPTDVVFAAKFYRAIGEFNEKMTELQKQAKKFERETATDASGLPVNAAERLEFVEEVCQYLKGKIDDLFGAGTSQTVFGDGMSIQAIQGFFEGIMPYVEKVRNKKMAKYLNEKSSLLK